MSEFASKIAAQVKSLGVSPQGEKFLMKALYPPGVETQVSIPDSSWHPTMRLDSRPALSFGVGAGAVVDASWDAMVLAVPGDVTAAIVVTAPAGTEFFASTAPANFSVKLLSNLPSTITASTTRKYWAASRTSAGASTEVSRTSVPNPMGVSSFRSTYRGFTLHNTSSALYDGGTLIAGQFAAASTDQALQLFTRNAVSMYAMRRAFTLPLDDGALTQMCPGAQAVDAKEGIFMPLRLLGPVQEFVSEPSVIGCASVQNTATSVQETVVAGNVAATEVSNTSAPCVLDANGTGGGNISSFGNPFWYSTMQGLAGKVDDTNFDNVAFGIVFLRNLPYQASFSLQAYVGIEAILDNSSAFRSLTMATAAYDPRAMQTYYDIVASMPFSYPASYNSLGAVLPYISRALTALRPVVGPFLGTLLRRGAAYLEGPAPSARAVAAQPRVPPQPPARPVPAAMPPSIGRSRPKATRGKTRASRHKRVRRT